MSEGDTFWISLGEKVLGLFLLILGVLLLHYTVTSTVELSMFTGFFGFLGVAVLIIGIVLLLVKPPE